MFMNLYKMVLNYKKNVIIYYKWLEQLEKIVEEKE